MLRCLLRLLSPASLGRDAIDHSRLPHDDSLVPLVYIHTVEVDSMVSLNIAVQSYLAV